ncbi:hypothetical protein [Corynebacterium glutamicum]|uniref:hypothetical protein n=1 Tax=Corynebacterium glutamicum TaxID=1718 RepID=UPI000744AA4B|nr:hypothetical protein [Corynebacterium glutamicum]AMA00219.1 hypothetical protein APT58_08270 [Corynebacterium glutamicum]
MLESVFSGTISGVVSGLIVAGALTQLSKLRQPLFELRHISDGKVLLSYNGLRPVYFGGHFELGEGEHLLFPTDGRRGAFHELELRTRGELVLDTTLHLGQSVSISYKQPWWLMTRRAIKRREANGKYRKMRNTAARITVMDLYSSEIDKEFAGWKVFTLILKP